MVMHINDNNILDAITVISERGFDGGSIASVFQLLETT